MTNFTTPAGKEIALVRCPKTAHIKLQFTSGGELPAELAGLYTSETAAVRDITKYIDSKESKKTTAESK